MTEVAFTTPAALIPGWGYALIVGAGFALEGPDAAPAPGSALIRLDGAKIGSSGLGNSAGISVELRDSSGSVRSRYGGYLDFSPRRSAGTSAERIDESACDARSSWRISPSPSPGAGARAQSGR